MSYDKSYYLGKSSGYVFSYNIMRFPLIWKEEVNTVTKYLATGKILDAGCAYGYFLRNLPNAFEKFGVDYSEYAINEARNLHGSLAQFQQCDISQEIPFNSQYQFDMVTCFNVLEHFEQPQPVIQSLVSVLKPKGFLYVRLPFRDPPFCRDQYHFYRPVEEWLSILTLYNLQLVEEKYWFTLWGKFSDLRMPRKLANFMGIVLQR